MRFGIAVFPGTWSDGDCARAVEVLGHESVRLWHRERDLQGSDCVISGRVRLRRPPSHRRRRPVRPAHGGGAGVRGGGGLVLGICNGFQILCEAHLLPGALTRNARSSSAARPPGLRVETVDTPFTRDCERGGVLAIPVSHGEGRFVADPSTLDRLEAEQRVAFRYVAPDGSAVGEASPNGSMRDIAGIVSEGRNVLGMMPHPERAAEPLLGSGDGMGIFRSVVEAVAERSTFAVVP